MFGTEINKKRYSKTRKVVKSMKDDLLNRAKKKYKIVKDLGRGKYIIDEEFTEDEIAYNLKNKNKRLIEYPFVKYDKTFDTLRGVYSIVFENKIYIGSTIDSFRGRSSTYSSNVKNKLTTKYCGGDFLIEEGGVMEIVWATSLKDEKIIRDKEKEFIKYYKNSTLFDVVNKSNRVFCLNRGHTKKNKVRYRNIKIDSRDFDRALQILSDNNIENRRY